jgi:succinate-semialdehyde dehydrogenase/glutarate-semialdehyde dehydrogenase
MRDGETLYVDGAWGSARSAATADAVNPATGSVIGLVSRGDREDARRAMEAAARAVGPGRPGTTWATWSAFDRAAAMERVVDVLTERREDLAQALTADQGKPLNAEAYDEVDELIVYFRMAAADATRLEGLLPPSIDAAKRVLVQRVPRGVVGIITPWNWPYTMAAEVIAPALAAGNAVVWNPAMHTSLCSALLAECIAAADLPPGVFNLVTGPGSEVGDELAAHPLTAAIGFVGSTATGRRVAERAAGKELLLEMGGNGPLVVLEDADLARAVDATLTACYLNAGQSCTAGERILVAEAVHDEYVARLHAAVADRVRLGDPLAEATTMGPLNNEAAAAKTERHVNDAVDHGATLVAGGLRDPDQASPLFYAPTILDDVTEEMAVAREETFGPVAPVTSIVDVDDAVAIVNASPYGLLSAVFTADLGRGLRFAESVRSGWVNINEGTNYWESHLPFGGRAGSQSGVGRVGGRFAMERLTELKTIVIDLGG